MTDIENYPWSSYREYTGASSFVDSAFVLDMFSSVRDEALKLFEKFPRENNTDACLEVEERKISMSDENLRK